MKKILKNKFSQFCDHVNKDYELYVPVEKEGLINFSRWENEVDINLETKTNTSPKNFIFPQSEAYLKFKSEGKKLKIERSDEDRGDYVLLGVKPCDAKAFNLIDHVFLREPVDRLYEEKRDKGVIISAACVEPEETCFCSSFDINPEELKSGSDIFIWTLENSIIWKPLTEKGTKLTKKLEGILEDANDKDLEELEIVKDNIRKKIKELPFTSIDPQKIQGDLNELFESEVWNQVSKSCLGCGACTYVCPTCHCYDIQDFDGQKNGERFRCWDSCMFSDFTLMAHGNPRVNQKERFRQRFMHKLVYYPNNHGEYACVGCGRCIEKCPVNMNIVKVIKKLGGEI